jgi:O-antigen/teichoic acid export membrane protein
MALGYFLPSVASTFNTRLDQMLNTIWLSSASIGRYGVALSGLSVGFGFLNAFQMVFFAAEVGGEPSIILKKVAEASRALTIVAFALVAVTIIAGRFVLLGFYGSRYDGAYVILLSLILSVPLMTVIGAVYQAFRTLGKPLLSFVSEMTGAVTGGLLLWALTPRFGAVGAGAADTLSYGCDLAVVLWQWTRIGGRVGDLVPRRPDAKRVMSVAGRYVVGVLGERIRRRSGVAS